ncbi:alpha/beta hydrolase [Agrobacterium pusense]|uniref:alpha/beta hydrolase n=1 Tax=Agrobacterium pusense TaxID=648995 RepID=UPI0013AF61D0
MFNVQHAEWLREGVSAWNRRRKKVKFSPNLAGLKLFDFLPADYRDSPKTSRYFEKIDLSSANLEGADLSHLNFARANFKHARLIGADLSLSNFTGARFRYANLTEARVENARFRGANFEHAYLQGVRLESADVERAIFVAAKIDVEQELVLRAKSAVVFQSVAAYEVAKEQDAFLAMKSRKAGPDDKSGKNRYDVYFATNRTAIFERGELRSFGDADAQGINYGVCEVLVPDGHRVGSLGSPLWKRLWNRQDDRLRLEHLIALSDELFWKFIADMTSKMSVKETPTIFIHGFNTDFESAVLRAAQLGYDLGLGQGIGLFSWPSKGGVLNYSADEAAAEASKYALANFINDFVEKTPGQSVNFIAHSMGCRCLVGALEHLAYTKSPAVEKVHQIILAGADVDAKIMPHQGQRFLKRCRRATSYVSDLDKALKISGWLHGNPRVGFSPPTFVLEGMDTILVNDKDLGDYAHGYFAASRTVLNDIFQLLQSDTPPSKRFTLESVIGSETSYWRIRY